MEEEHLTTASAAGKAMAMMRRVQKEKDEVQMELRSFAAEIDHLCALIAVEERDAEAEEEIFRSAGRTLLLYKEEHLDLKQINCITNIVVPQVPGIRHRSTVIWLIVVPQVSDSAVAVHR